VAVTAVVFDVGETLVDATKSLDELPEVLP
jgi:hypothetical protein